MLPQIAQPQLGMADDLAAVELFLAQQDAQQRALAGAVAADEADLHVVGERGRSAAVEQHLVAVAFVSILDLQQHGHEFKRGVSPVPLCVTLSRQLYSSRRRLSNACGFANGRRHARPHRDHRRLPHRPGSGALRCAVLGVRRGRV